MNYSQNSNNGNMNIPNFGMNMNNNMSYPPPYQVPNNNGANFQQGGQGQQPPGPYNTNFNPFDILGRRL